MNVNQIVMLVIRMVMRRVLRTGVDAGINAVGSRMNKNKTADERGQSPGTADTVKRAKKAMRMSRKIGRL